jgi:hypothetical protein
MPEELQTPSTPLPEPEIHVIPEKFYGAALKAKVPEIGEKPAAAAPTGNGLDQPRPRSKVPMIVGGILVLLLIVGGAFAYFNQELLFPKKTEPTPTPETKPEPPKPVVVEPPSTPANFSGTSTSPQSASLSWVDTSANESGFRLDRAEDQGSFAELTNLPPNSTSFIDTTVTAGKTYRYRILARNSGGESAPSSEASVAVAALPPPVPEAPKLPPAGLDTDSDGLTDLEEPILGSDTRSPDTDHDGFLDGNEVFHLYNPNGTAPARLLEAKLVKLWTATVGWTMQVPNSWTTTLEAADGSKGMISTGHGEVFRISVEENLEKKPVLDWYLGKNPEVKADQVLQYRSKKGYEGIIGADLLTTYIPWGDRIFVFKYELGKETFINFRTLYSMILNSLELQGVPVLSAAIVAEKPLPFEPNATTTGVVAQPESVTTTAPEAQTTP